MQPLVCEYYDGFSFGNFIKNFPELKNTITDLLIGDLFHDRVDAVWQPMESTYGAHKKSISAWTAPVSLEAQQAKVNELFLPEGPKP